MEGTVRTIYGVNMFLIDGMRPWDRLSVRLVSPERGKSYAMR